MDKGQEIAISRMADILSSSNLVIPSVDIWKKIFNNAGLSDLYETRSPQFTTRVEAYGFRPDEKNYYHNEMCYNALYKSFKDLEYDRENFLKLLQCIVEKININCVFISDVERIIKKENPCIKDMYIDEFINHIGIADKDSILTKYANKNFKVFRSNCNILELEVCFDDEGLGVFPFTGGVRESSFDNSILIQWLERKYANVAESYTDAIKAYSNGDEIGCITHCRNVITGIFTYKKDVQRKWIDGLQKVCNKDKHIDKVTANRISSFHYNANSSNENDRYQYPRFNLIYKLYSYTSALGAHINEGNVTDNSIEFEEATLEDAFMALRMTEDMLIWLYQTNSIDA